MSKTNSIVSRPTSHLSLQLINPFRLPSEWIVTLTLVCDNSHVHDILSLLFSVVLCSGF